jgi:hypothetical protein
VGAPLSVGGSVLPFLPHRLGGRPSKGLVNDWIETVTVIAGILYLIVVGVGGCLIVRRQSAGMFLPGDLLVCRLLTVFVIFFFAFDVLGALGLFFHERWVTFPNAIVVAIAVIAAGHICGRRYPRKSMAGAEEATTWSSSPALNGTTRLVAAAVAGGFILVAALLVIGFPRGHEANAYHLPSAINFFRDASLRIWDKRWLHTLPANASLWDGFWLRLLPERVVSVVNLPFLGLCVLLLYRLCRFSGADRSAAALISSGITTIPLFGFCSTELGADVAGVAFALTAFWLALSQPPSFPNWSVLAGSASGLAYGYKPLHLVTAALVGLLILCGRGPSMRPRPSPSARMLHTACFAAAFLALAGIWLLRNEVELGNPFYPIPLGGLPELLGFTPAPDWPYDDFKYYELEWVDAPWQWLIYPWVEGQRLHQNFKFSSGLGPFFAATVPVAWIAWGTMLVREPWRYRERSDGDRAARVLYVCGTVIFLAWWVSGSRQPRYVMIGIAALLPLAAVLITSTSGWIRQVYEITLGLGTLFMLAVLVSYTAVAEGPLLNLGRLPTRAEVFEYPPRIDDLPAGSVILDLADRPAHYQLYGANLSNRVVSYPTATTLFREGDEWNLRAADIRRLGITHAYAFGLPRLVPGCVKLEQEARLEGNPFNSVPFDQPRILFRVVDDCPAQQ